MSTPFRFHVPVVAFEKGLPNGKKSKRIGGIVTSPNKDRQDETMLLDGLDFSEFEHSGWFNDNHGKSTTDVVGLPDAAVRRVRKGDSLPDGGKARTDGYWAEGVLMGSKGDEVFRLAKDLEGTGRALGFSVEGTIVERAIDDSKKITKAKVRNIAVTHCPVNPDTELVILSKALSSGTGLPATEAIPGSGAPLRVESLDPEIKYLTYGGPGPSKTRKKKAKKQPLTEQQAVKVLKSIYPRMSDNTARWIYALASGLKRQGAEVVA